ncbi:hypothetical protein JA9_003130 [Meyerozyma sp. JA9]|nr:hypothetical protein JA9_003130 [Meyerozyma sp. JA9]
MSGAHKSKLINRVHSAFSRPDGPEASPPTSVSSAPPSSKASFSKPKLSKNPPQLDRSSSSDIFERSISTSSFSPPLSAVTSQSGQSQPPLKHSVAHSVPHSARSRSMSTVSASSQMSGTPYAIPMHHNTEDFVAPVLDTTTEVLSDPSIDMNDVEIVCPCDTDDDSEHDCAAVRPPVSRSRSRSRSIISMSLRQCISGANSTSVHSGSGSVSPTMAHVKSNSSLANRSSSLQSMVDKGDLSPSKTTINFYSFADMVNAENHMASLSLGPTFDETVQEEDPLYETNEEDHHASPGDQSSTSERIENFYGFRLGSPPNKFHRTRSHGSTTSGVEPNDPRSGYQSMSVKEYISSVPQ